MVRRSVTVLVALLGVAACNSPGASESGFTTPGVTTRPVETSSSGSSSSGADSSSTSTGPAVADDSAGSSETDDTRLDMGDQPDFDDDPPGCKGKIDFLFVVSRAGITAEAQMKIAAAAPDFIATIQAEFDDFDVHIMVVDSEKNWSAAQCDKQCPDPCDKAPDYPCYVEPSVCDQTLGAGTVYNVGPYAPNVPCELGEHRYITADTPDIPAAFDCIIRVGTSGGNAMGDALVAAVSLQLNASEPAPGGCNAGFLRDDALLVLTMIGPEDTAFGPGASEGTWQAWRQAVVDAKHGDLDAIVALGIISGEDCMGGIADKYRLCNLVPSFPHSLLGHLTLDDFGPVFDEAAQLALDACSLFIPG